MVWFVVAIVVLDVAVDVPGTSCCNSCHKADDITVHLLNSVSILCCFMNIDGVCYCMCAVLCRVVSRTSVCTLQCHAIILLIIITIIIMITIIIIVMLLLLLLLLIIIIMKILIIHIMILVIRMNDNNVHISYQPSVAISLTPLTTTTRPSEHGRQAWSQRERSKKKIPARPSLALYIFTLAWQVNMAMVATS